METALILKILVLIVGFYMAWNIGANDVSNAMGTSVGSGALTMKRAVILAAILEFSGAYFVGANVSETMQRGLIDTKMFLTNPNILSIGMCAALLGTGAWLQFASYFGLPVSTTHAIVGAILGFGLLIGGVGTVQWEEISAIALSWIVSPLVSGVISYIIFSLMQRKILFALDPTEASRKFIPPLVFIVFATFTLSLIFNGLSNLDLNVSFPQAVVLSIIIGSIAALLALIVVKKVTIAEAVSSPSKVQPQSVISLDKAIKHLQRVQVTSDVQTHDRITTLLTEMQDLSQSFRRESHFFERTSHYRLVEKWFAYLQIISACFVAFAHGANDVANAIGPVAAVLDIVKNGSISEIAPIPSWLLVFGGIGIVIGLSTWGWRVIETIGKRITELTPTRGFCAEFAAAITILIASKLGLPISTTHCLVGAVLGVGMARGIRALNLMMLKDIVLSWIITIPASALMSICFFYILKWSILG